MEIIQYIVTFLLIIFIVINNKKNKITDKNIRDFIYPLICRILIALILINSAILYTKEIHTISSVISVSMGIMLGIFFGNIELKKWKIKILYHNEILMTKKKYNKRLIMILISIIIGALLYYGILSIFHIEQKKIDKYFTPAFLNLMGFYMFVSGVIIMSFIYKKIIKDKI